MGAVWDTQCNSLTFLRPPWCRTNRATTWNLARGLPEVTLQEINERLLEKRFSDLGDGNSNMILGDIIPRGKSADSFRGQHCIILADFRSRLSDWAEKTNFYR
jgi:hypothetical protein